MWQDNERWSSSTTHHQPGWPVGQCGFEQNDLMNFNKANYGKENKETKNDQALPIFPVGWNDLENNGRFNHPSGDYKSQSTFRGRKELGCITGAKEIHLE